jgi:hypothetical protein
VKPIKMLGLAALAALMAMAFVGASSAMASEPTSLCKEDPAVGGTGLHAVCPADKQFTHVHDTTLTGKKATLLSSVINVECDVLFLGDVLSSLVEPPNKLVIHGHFTYTNCNSGCEVTEESEDALIEVLKTAHELAEITGKGEVRVHCGIFINCVYNGTGLKGHGLGPLLSEELKGDIKISEQVTNRVSGFCPETAKLDILTTPLEHTYITE